MSEAFAYTGCRVIVYDQDTGSTVADTKILHTDPYGKIISVARAVFKGQLPERLSVLIFTQEGLYAYLGALRKTGVSAGLAEMALYGGRYKEDRKAVRYELNAIAMVKNTIVNQKLVPLPQPVEVLVVNMSPVGCLIRGGVGCFDMADCFQLCFVFQGAVTDIPTKVTRINNLDDQMAEYGCTFLVPNTQWVEMDMDKHRVAPLS